MADNLTTFMCRLSRNLGASTSWNPKGLLRPVMGRLLRLPECPECPVPISDVEAKLLSHLSCPSCSLHFPDFHVNVRHKITSI
jgi:hypothetical protein